MGSFFTNVQIWRGAGRARAPRGQLVAAVADAVKDAAGTEGYVETGAGDDADRSILIAKTADNDPWLPIYDEATEGQDVRKLDALASQLSARLETIAVGVLVHDSDVLELRLFDNGQLVDRYNSQPGYFGAEVNEREAAEAAGHPERWARLLRDGKTPADLGAAWREQATFAEVVLSATAKVLGWDDQLASTGYAHSADGDQVEPLLRLRWGERPQAERSLDGPPRFGSAGYTVEATFAIGEPLALHHSVRNLGGASRGVHVAVWGDAIERGLVAPTDVELVIGPRLHVHQAKLIAEGRGMFRVGFPDADIPAGHEISEADMHRLGPRKAIALMHASHVSVALTGTVTAVGSGKVCIGFVPHASPNDGQYGHQTSIKVTASKRKR